MRRIGMLSLTVVSIILMSCAAEVRKEPANPLTTDKVAQIIDGTTTEREIRALFGLPAHVKTEGGSDIYSYEYCSVVDVGSVSGGGYRSTVERCNRLTIDLDKQSRVVKRHRFQQEL